MTDNEIIKALGCCATNNCIKCPWRNDFDECVATRAFYDLIKRQQAEIEELQSEITLLKQSNANLQELYQGEKEKVANAKQKVIDIAKALKTAKADAIKEFAERVVDLIYEADDVNKLSENQIDNLVEEMVGDTDG